MNIKITKIHIYRGAHRDTVWVYTELPDPMFPYNGSLDLKFTAAYQTGLDYVRRHFPGVPLSMITTQGEETTPENPAREGQHEGGEADVVERQAVDSGGDQPR